MSIFIQSYVYSNLHVSTLLVYLDSTYVRCCDETYINCIHVLNIFINQRKPRTLRTLSVILVCFMLRVFNATFNNILVISWRSVLLVEETRVPGEIHGPAAIHCTLHMFLDKLLYLHKIMSGEIPGYIATDILTYTNDIIQYNLRTQREFTTPRCRITCYKDISIPHTHMFL